MDASASQPEGEVPETEQAASGGNESEASASISDLVALEKCKTLVFGPSVVSKNAIEFYISKGFFKEGDCRPPEGETTPAPKEGEVVVFRDCFHSWFKAACGPCYPLSPGAFERKASPPHSKRHG